MKNLNISLTFLFVIALILNLFGCVDKGGLLVFEINNLSGNPLKVYVNNKYDAKDSTFVISNNATVEVNYVDFPSQGAKPITGDRMLYIDSIHISKETGEIAQKDFLIKDEWEYIPLSSNGAKYILVIDENDF